MAGADFLQLDPATAPPRGLASWLASALRTAVADGRLPVDARLPATRALAAELDLSRGVVVEAYQRLVDEGILAGHRGGGTVVRAGATRPAGGVPEPSVTPIELDLSPGVPDLSAFPRAAWLRAERTVLTAMSASDLRYGDPRGAFPLRSAVAGWLSRTRGIRADPDQLLIVNGVAQTLSLLAHVLRDRGRGAIGVEEPGSFGARNLLQRWNFDTVPIPVDDLGLDIAALTATGVDTVLVTPAHQFPTGVVLAAARRRALQEWASAGGLVIEDDYDAEHRYDRAPVAALHTLAPDRIVYTGSVSKILAPALRIGWLLAPADLRADLIDAKYHSDIASPVLGQLALAELMTNGAIDRHLRLTRSRHRRRRNAVLAALAEHLPGARVHGVAAGLHLLVSLPDLGRATDTEAADAVLAERALAEGVAVHPLSWYQQRPGEAGLVIGYAASPPDQLHEAIRRVGALVTRF
ncbi:MAG TPA: PLP-dependent aminotransferase family protein [Pseudonocardiaceae bacterium]|jgi:GntR family transcriptional regulator/MocR family aminotransferase|nr:PLP-dependent aminotransferase family protein [Pseudonocardiaceae bacterium]